MSPRPAAARTSPASERNREPILAVLRRFLAPDARVLEVASGAGQHAAWFAQAFPRATWRPTDPDATALASIAAWREVSGATNLLAPLRLDAADPATWPAGPFDAVVCINMVHISPWRATQGLMSGAAQVLTPGCHLFLYGPYVEADVATAPSNLAFDIDLRLRNPEWGLRDLADVVDLAAGHGLELVERVAMPANNLSLIFHRNLR